QCFDIQPDIVSTAKGLGGGLPIGAVLLSEKVQYTLGPGDHGSTYGGNPVAAAAGVSIIKRIDDKLLEEVAKKGAFLKSSLEGAEGIELVTGLGLMVGVKPSKKSASDVVKACMAKGVLCLTAKDRIRLLPALTISYEELETAASVIKECCKD
ncbi:MAG: aminotransferase class III-fold pyridoxal phosphate-dependent enzyme, partial [Spirochaetales bacterium]|nr:aminotransferase class III-fold pyridoxal phosphate-dependent enzyme [Candidatus Physcosoma equi]